MTTRLETREADIAGRGNWLACGAIQGHGVVAGRHVVARRVGRHRQIAGRRRGVEREHWGEPRARCSKGPTPLWIRRPAGRRYSEPRVILAVVLEEQIAARAYLCPPAGCPFQTCRRAHQAHAE